MPPVQCFLCLPLLRLPSLFCGEIIFCHEAKVCHTASCCFAVVVVMVVAVVVGVIGDVAVAAAVIYWYPLMRYILSKQS